MTLPTAKAYGFDGFRLDLVQGTLRDPGGADLHLRPKAFAALRYLLENAGRLIGRDALMDALWPGLAVTDDSLTQCISEIRGALGDRAGKVLRTVPRRGYILASPVTVLQDDAQLAVLPARPSVPTLPEPGRRVPDPLLRLHHLEASGIGGDAERQVTAMLSTEVFTDLARSSGLRVRVMPAAHAAGGDDGGWDRGIADGMGGRGGPAAIWPEDGPQDAGFADHPRHRRHGDMPAMSAARPPPAGYVLWGKLLLLEGEIRVSLWLSRASGPDALWADRFQYAWPDPGGLEALSTRLVDTIIHQVEREELRLARRLPLEALGARQLCLMGLDHYTRGNEADTMMARSLFDRAMTVEPDYALAHTWQAYAMQRAWTNGWGPPSRDVAWQQLLALARTGVQLAPESPLAVARLAYSLTMHHRWDEAMDTIFAMIRNDRALDFSTRTTCGLVLSKCGRPQEALALLRRVLAVDPFTPPSVRQTLGQILLLAGQPEAALSELRWCAARLPDFPSGFHDLVVAAVETGRLEEARAALVQVRRLLPGWRPSNAHGNWCFRQPEVVARFTAAFRAVGLEAGNDAAGDSGHSGAGQE